MKYFVRMIGQKEVWLVRTDTTIVFEKWDKNTKTWLSNVIALDAFSGMSSDTYKEVSVSDAQAYIRKHST